MEGEGVRVCVGAWWWGGGVGADLEEEQSSVH